VSHRLVGQKPQSLIRIPASRGNSTRIELRSPDPSCNPYLAFAVCLVAGLDGVKRGLTPPPAVDLNIFEMDETERRQRNVRGLPTNLKEAVQAMAADKVVMDALGSHISERYAAAKLNEWEEYRTHVDEWERDRYFKIY
jgi:glutamine synthetase